jgi:hypothetical protein
MWYVFVQNIIIYALIKLKGPKCGKLVTIYSVLYLSCIFLYEMYTEYGSYTLNASTLLMILTCKYSLLAYNL